MNEATKKPWPGDAVMIVCATPEEARPERMESVNPGKCRDCGRAIVYDGFTYRRAELPRLRRGRPIRFFCVECSVNYDADLIDHIEDHRGRGPGTPGEWQDAVDWAEGLVRLDSARKYGLVTGGPEVDLDRCEWILEQGRRRGVRPSADAPERVVAALMQPTGE